MLHSSSAPDLGSLPSGRRSAAMRETARSRLHFLPPEAPSALPHSASAGSFSPAQDRLNRTAPGAMLHGLSAFAKDENRRVERNLNNIRESKRKDSKTRWRTVQATVMVMHKLMAVKPGPRESFSQMDGEVMEREMDNVSASISQLRRRHETFQPMSPNQAARQNLFGSPQEAAPSSPGRSPANANRPANHLSPEERRERFELLKFVRKIEPDLPPLERTPHPKEPPPNQALVNFNASSEAIQRWRPDVRTKLLGENAAEHTEHVREVGKNAQAVKAAARARKRELGELRALGKGVNTLGDLPDAAGQWLVLCAAGSFLHGIHHDLRLHKVQDKHEHVETHWDRLRRMKMPRRTLTAKMVQMVGKTRGEEFSKRAPLLGAFFFAKIAVWRKRTLARQIGTCLKAWQAAGPMFLQLRRIGSLVRKIQRWYRHCAEKVHKMQQQVAEVWMDIEYDIIVSELQDLGTWSTSEEYDALEARIDKARIPARLRMRFIEHELRARRYLLLPRIYMHQEDTRRWQQEVREWRVEREARMVISNGEPVELPAFSWAPVEPTYRPTRDEVQQMLRKAMTNPAGWTDIRNSKQVKMGKRKTAHGQGSQRKTRTTAVHFSEQLVLNESAATEEEEDYLRRLGISAVDMPGGLARPPPPTTECEGEDD